MELSSHPFSLLLDYIAETGMFPPRFVALDIETRKNPDADKLLGPPPDNQKGLEALDPARMEVACIQLMDPFGRFLLIEGDTESSICEHFYRCVSPTDDPAALITYNGTNFDLPAIETRSRINRVRVPDWFRRQDKWGRRTVSHLDVGELLGFPRRMMKMHDVARLMGRGGKTEEIGEFVGDMLRDPKKREAAIAYAKSDVVTTIQNAYDTRLLHEFNAGSGREPFLLDTITDENFPDSLPDHQEAFLESLPMLMSERSKLESGNTKVLDKFPAAAVDFLTGIVERNGLKCITNQSLLHFLRRFVASRSK